MQSGCQLKEVYKDRIEKTFPYNDKENCRTFFNFTINILIKMINNWNKKYKNNIIFLK